MGWPIIKRKNEECSYVGAMKHTNVYHPSAYCGRRNDAFICDTLEAGTSKRQGCTDFKLFLLYCLNNIIIIL